MGPYTYKEPSYGNGEEFGSAVFDSQEQSEERDYDA
jgi:hypothetical protein